MATKSNFGSVMRMFVKDIVDNIRSKWYGCFVDLAACLFTFMLVITYCFVTKDLFNPAVITYAVTGIVMYLVFSLFFETSKLAAIVLMVFDFLCFVGFAQAGGMIDYFSTKFFDGFSVGKFFSLPAADWLSIVLLVLAILTSAAGMYMPQNRKLKAKAANARTEQLEPSEQIDKSEQIEQGSPEQIVVDQNEPIERSEQIETAQTIQTVEQLENVEQSNDGIEQEQAPVENADGAATAKKSQSKSKGKGKRSGK